MARAKIAASEIEQRDRSTKVAYWPNKFVEEEETTEGWQSDLLMEEHLWKTLKTLLSGDPVLQMEAMDDREDSMPNLKSRDIIQYTGRDLYHHPDATGCWICRSCSTRINYWISNKIKRPERF